MRPFEVRSGMVVVGDDASPVLVQKIAGPIPSVACWAPYRFTGTDLRTGAVKTVVVPQSRMAEVLSLPERTVEFVCRQDEELILWDAEAGRVASLPEVQRPGWQDDLPPNTPVVVLFYEGRPVWVCGRA